MFIQLVETMGNIPIHYLYGNLMVNMDIDYIYNNLHTFYILLIIFKGGYKINLTLDEFPDTPFEPGRPVTFKI